MRGFFVEGAFRAFNQRKNVAHAQHARNDALGIEAFERVVFFAKADELYRRASHFADGKRRATARVTVELGENDAGEAEALVKFAGGTDRVLPDHGVGDEQHFAGLQFLFQSGEFVHQLVVDVQAAGGVDKHDVAGGEFRFLDRAAHNFQRFVRAGGGPNGNADGLGDLRKLFASGGTIHVGGNHDRPVAMLRQPLRQFAGGGGFTGTLQADDHPDRRRARGEQRLGVFAEKIEQFVANNLDDLLVGRKLQHDFGAESLGADVGEEFVRDANVDVAFQQGFADFSERGVQVLVGELALPAQILESSLQLVCQVLKHGFSYLWVIQIL